MSVVFFLDDVKALTKTSSLLKNLKWFLMCHTLHLVFFIRIGQSVRSIPFLGEVLRAVVEYFIRIVFSSDISCKSSIDRGFVIMHGHDIVIGADVVLGRGCTIFNGVTLGNRDIRFSSAGQQPSLRDNVVLCTGAKVLGPVTLEDGCVVGANCVVINSFPAGSVIVGVPGRSVA